jgi:REP element-mobilizing transposase RayT
MKYPEHWPYFFTATIYQWQHLLKVDKFKDVIIESLRFLVKEKRIELNAFVIMSNHIHVIWQPLPGYSQSKIQASFMKHTAKQFKQLLEVGNIEMLSQFKVTKYDRDYQFWKREPLSVELFTEIVFMQKLEYIHDNPVRARLCKYAEQYYYSSQMFYEKGIDVFGIVTHYAG